MNCPFEDSSDDEDSVQFNAFNALPGAGFSSFNAQPVAPIYPGYSGAKPNKASFGSLHPPATKPNVSKRANQQSPTSGKPNLFPVGFQKSASSSPLQKSKVSLKTPRRKGVIEDKALEYLKEIPGITEDSALHSFSKGYLLPYSDPNYNHIREYIRNSQQHNYGIKVSYIMSLERFDDSSFDSDANIQRKKRMLLFHGTKLKYIAPILQDGFQPPPAKKQMFGTGIYFADRCSKSANYCDSTKPGQVGYLILCEVAVGKSYVAKRGHTEYTQAPSITKSSGLKVPCDSVMCAGKLVPDEDENEILPNGCVVPLGESIKNGRFSNCTLRHNEFIVYDPSLAKIRYLVKIQFRNDVYEF